jgi:hypothetical protein
MVRSVRDFKSIAKKIFGADDIIEPIIAAQLEKKKAERTAECDRRSEETQEGKGSQTHRPRTSRKRPHYT